jgi:hypothetical protein
MRFLIIAVIAVLAFVGVSFASFGQPYWPLTLVAWVLLALAVLLGRWLGSTS